MRSEKFVDKVNAQSWLDRVPLVPMWFIWTLAAVIGINGLMGLIADVSILPWWVSFPLLGVFFLLIFRAERAQKAKAKRDEKV